MNQPTIRINPPEMEDIIKRLERLEELIQMSGAMLLFLVDDGEFLHWLVVAPRFEDVKMMIPKQANIEYLGRAGEFYTRSQIIRAWDLRPDDGHDSPYR